MWFERVSSRVFGYLFAYGSLEANFTPALLGSSNLLCLMIPSTWKMYRTLLISRLISRKLTVKRYCALTITPRSIYLSKSKVLWPSGFLLEIPLHILAATLCCAQKMRQ